VKFMTATLLRRASDATAKSEEFYQLRLPLFTREQGRDGLLLKNTTFVDAVRRIAIKRLPVGAPERMAGLLGCRVDRIYDEHRGEIRYSMDVFTAALLHLPRHESRRALRPIAQAIGALVIEDPRVDEWQVAR
jgi:hypothetical protein